MANSIKILFDARDFARVAKQVRLGSKRVREYVDLRIKFLALGMTRTLTSATPKKTGKLAGSSKAIQEAESRWRIVQTATASKRGRSGYLYGRGLRFGTSSHLILPRFARALYWPGIKGGRPVKIVKHPGTAPDRYDFVTVARSKGLRDSVARSIAAEGALRYVGKKS